MEQNLLSAKKVPAHWNSQMQESVLCPLPANVTAVAGNKSGTDEKPSDILKIANVDSLNFYFMPQIIGSFLEKHRRSQSSY